jgi:hypothetical protein
MLFFSRSWVQFSIKFILISTFNLPGPTTKKEEERHSSNYNRKKAMTIGTHCLEMAPLWSSYWANISVVMYIKLRSNIEGNLLRVYFEIKNLNSLFSALYLFLVSLAFWK